MGEQRFTPRVVTSTYFITAGECQNHTSTAAMADNLPGCVGPRAVGETGADADQLCGRTGQRLGLPRWRWMIAHAIGGTFLHAENTS